MKADTQFVIDQFARESKNVLQDNIFEEYLFGSYATQTQTLLSDIDILVIVKQFTPIMQSQLSSMASEYALTYDLCISPILTDLETWGKNKRCNTLFCQEIGRHGIRL